MIVMDMLIILYHRLLPSKFKKNIKCHILTSTVCYVQNDTIKVTKSAHTVCIYSYLVQTEKSLFSLSTDLPIVAEVIQNLLLIKKLRVIKFNYP